MTEENVRQLLSELNNTDLHPRLEAKKGVGKSLYETICSFCNAPSLGAIDNQTLRQITNSGDTLATSSELRKLCDLGYIEKKGAGTATYYESGPKFPQFEEPDAATEVGTLGDELDTLEGELGTLDEAGFGNGELAEMRPHPLALLLDRNPRSLRRSGTERPATSATPSCPSSRSSTSTSRTRKLARNACSILDPTAVMSRRALDRGSPSLHFVDICNILLQKVSS